MFTKQEIIEILRRRYKEGQKVKLIKMDDIQAPPPGTMGVVTGVDDAGHIHVKWETGSSLSLIYGEDVFEPIDEEETA